MVQRVDFFKQKEEVCILIFKGFTNLVYKGIGVSWLWMLFASFGFSDYNLVFAALHMFLWGEVSKTFNTFSAVYKYNKLGNTFLYCIFFPFLSSPPLPPPPPPPLKTNQQHVIVLSCKNKHSNMFKANAQLSVFYQLSFWANFKIHFVCIVHTM